MKPDPTGRFAAVINAMTPGNLSETTYSDAFCDLRSDAENAPVAIGLTREDAAGIIASVALARLMVSERAVEIMARATYGGPDWDFANQNIRDFRVQRARAAIAAILKEVEG
jgi:hypothetical protein